MISPDEIVTRAARLYIPFLQAWLNDDAAFFPQTFAVGKLPADYSALNTAVKALLKADKVQRGYGYSVSLTTRQTQKYGTQTIPARISIETAPDLLRLLGKETEFAAFQADVGRIRTALPQLEDWLAQHPQQVVDRHGAWPDLLQVCGYFLAHPRPGLYIRELPLTLHTKFVEDHSTILRRLLDALLPEDAINRADAIFERRYGLRYDEPLVRLRLLDDQLRQRYGLPVNDISLPLSQCAALDLHGQRCVIVENKMTFLTLPPLPATFAIFGGGFSVAVLAALRWLADCPIFYWGDLDAQGFHILAMLRGLFPHVASVLMDAATFADFREYVVTGTPCTLDALPSLTDAEHSLFLRLARTQERLEQERIPYAYATAALRAALEGAA